MAREAIAEREDEEFRDQKEAFYSILYGLSFLANEAERHNLIETHKILEDVFFRIAEQGFKTSEIQ